MFQCMLFASGGTDHKSHSRGDTNYDYETALMLIDQETPTVPYSTKRKALKGLGNNLEALSVFQEVVARFSQSPGIH